MHKYAQSYRLYWIGGDVSLFGQDYLPAQICRIPKLPLVSMKGQCLIGRWLYSQLCHFH